MSEEKLRVDATSGASSHHHGQEEDHDANEEKRELPSDVGDSEDFSLNKDQISKAPSTEEMETAIIGMLRHLKGDCPQLFPSQEEENIDYSEAYHFIEENKQLFLALLLNEYNKSVQFADLEIINYLNTHSPQDAELAESIELSAVEGEVEQLVNKVKNKLQKSLSKVKDEEGLLTALDELCVGVDSLLQNLWERLEEVDNLHLKEISSLSDSKLVEVEEMEKELAEMDKEASFLEQVFDDCEDFVLLLLDDCETLLTETLQKHRLPSELMSRFEALKERVTHDVSAIELAAEAKEEQVEDFIEELEETLHETGLPAAQKQAKDYLEEHYACKDTLFTDKDLEFAQQDLKKLLKILEEHGIVSQLSKDIPV